MTSDPSRPPQSAQDSPIDTGSTTVFSRRSLFRAGGAVGLAAVAGWSTTACETGPTRRQLDAEALLPHARAARRQHEAATALAGPNPDLSDALKVVAAQREEHLRALTDEINRLHSSLAGHIDSAATGPVASVEALAQQIDRSATDAAEACLAHSDYMAGLLGSISASCRTLAKVQLG